MIQQPHAHLARPPHKEPPAHAPNAALLIDFDNVTMGIRSDLQTELKRLLQSEIIRGKVAVQRAYADWRRYPQYIVPLSESSIDLIFAPAYGSNKKNATDIRLAIDALELVFTRPEIGTFILLSGDSDFSSLVLKLKEYGKYVIGVGIRESSSDLLIQNCDEYYSYNELAGFTKESDVEHVRRDPWELVVEAVKQMTAHNDVMRSDRLKQVMQEIDPAFSEKDAGFSRFSKFVVEAAHKGLINLTKLDNGQYEIALGEGVPGAAAQPAGVAPGSRPAPERARADRGPAPRRRRSPDENRGASRRGGGFSLGEAFGLLKQALGRFGADKPVSADQLRDTMIEIKGGDAEPLEPGRFPKLLQQAHDAEIIDLSREEDGAYAVKLRPDAPTEPEESEQAQEQRETPAPAASAPVAPAPVVGGIPTRSARFRRGSRGGAPRVAPPEIPKIGVVEVDPNFKPRIELVPASPPASEMPGGKTPSHGRIAEGDREHSGPEGRGGGGGHARGGPGGRGRGEAEPGERRERGGRGRRGARGGGRGGRARSVEESGGGERIESHEARPVAQPSVPQAPAQEPSPPASPPDTDSESFWSKVKRGLTGA